MRKKDKIRLVKQAETFLGEKLTNQMIDVIKEGKDKEVKMKCEIKKCRNESDVVVHGIELCEKHWKQLTEDFIGIWDVK